MVLSAPTGANPFFLRRRCMKNSSTHPAAAHTKPVAHGPGVLEGHAAEDVANVEAGAEGGAQKEVAVVHEEVAVVAGGVAYTIRSLATSGSLSSRAMTSVIEMKRRFSTNGSMPRAAHSSFSSTGSREGRGALGHILKHSFRSCVKVAKSTSSSLASSIKF